MWDILNKTEIDFHFKEKNKKKLIHRNSELN